MELGSGGLGWYKWEEWLVVTLSRCGSFLRVANFNDEWKGVCVFRIKWSNFMDCMRFQFIVSVCSNLKGGGGRLCTPYFATMFVHLTLLNVLGPG